MALNKIIQSRLKFNNTYFVAFAFTFLTLGLNQKLLAARGMIEAGNGFSIDCARTQNFTNADYRSIKNVFQADGITMDQLIYATSKDRPSIEALSPFRVAQNLNYPELYAILGYTGSGYEPINAALWQKNSAEIERLSMSIRVLCSALNKLPNYVGEVVRGTTKPGDLEYLNKGDVWSPKSFMSTSIGSAQLYKKLPVQIKIYSKSGKRIESFSFYDKNSSKPESEVLFIPRSNFVIKEKIVTKRPGMSDRYYVEVEEIEDSFVPSFFEAGPQKIEVSGSASESGGFMSSSEENSRELALAQCESEKQEQDIKGTCYIDCTDEGDSTSCRWKASDWFDMNPFYNQKHLDGYYRIR